MDPALTAALESIVAVIAALPMPVEAFARNGERLAANAAFERDIAPRLAATRASAFREQLAAGRLSAVRAAAEGATREIPLALDDGAVVTVTYFPIAVLTERVIGVAYAFLAAEARPERDASHEVRSFLVGAESTAVERQLRFIIDLVPQMIWSTLPDGFHDFYNRRWYEYIGGGPGDTRGAGWNDPLHPDDQQPAWERWRHSLVTGEPYEIEYRFRRFDGAYRWFLARALPLRDGAGKIVRWFGTCTDIHDQRTLAAQRAEVLAQAEANNRMKDEFLAIVSHELRTPMTSILGWAEMLKRKPEYAAKAVDVISRNARIQAQLIEDILDVSRIVTGKVRLNVAPVCMEDVLASALDTVKPSADARQITVTTRIGDLGVIAADADRVQQVVWNLLSNAVKFTPNGGLVELVATRADGQVRVCVRDTGKGIAPEFLPYVFDRFRQAEMATTRQHGGLGLGLAIVRHLVELHGGTALVESAGLGKGASFTISLPERVVASEEETAAASLPSGDRVSTPSVRLEGMRILLVDDERDARELVAMVLREAGAVVEEAAGVDDALALLADRVPDVLISDIGMPSKDGYALAAAVRARTESETIPAIALTAFARVDDAARARAAGFYLHLAKPVHPAALVAAVRSVSGERRSAPERASSSA